jgi:inosine-uridine nucleoside N-ribohydrolase
VVLRRRHAIPLSILLTLVVAASAQAAISARGPGSRATYAANHATRILRVAAPHGAQTGDVLVAALVFGRGSRPAPALTPPAGWTLIRRVNGRSGTALAVYRHAFNAGESRYVWGSSKPVGGTVEVAAFTGVDSARPIDRSAARVTAHRATIQTPSIKTRVGGAMLVASFGGFHRGGRVRWTAPRGMTELADAAAGSRSGSIQAGTQTSAGATGRKKARASARLSEALAILTALRPAGAGAPAIGAVQAQAVTPTSATIAWTTDRPSDSQVDYGTTPGYGSSTALDPGAVTSHSQTINGLIPGTLYHFQVKSRSSGGPLGASADLTFQTAALGYVPLIVDTDIFSSVDDVGALATAFALQLKGEAKVIAVGINTRLSRGAVATNSWRCAAAVAAFYGFPNVPIGAAMPDNGTALNSPDFIGPCSTLAPPGTPPPDTAVNVLRRALVAQPNGSVVIASTGYFGNLSALLDSPPDAISPLSGRDLIAQKVKMLVSMAGAFPNGAPENNFIGDPASAQNVAANWPTKLVWSGFEVGEQVHTGQTISSAQPASSPVRVAYEAFVAPGNWTYSHDLTAVYHAVRPGDPLLSEVGPGTNVVTSSGGNTFTSGAGNQYYLSLGDPTKLDASIEALLDTLPAR